MPSLAYIVMSLWIPITLVMFILLPPRRAIIAEYVVGWLFLPLAAIQISGLPDINKVTVTAVGALLGVILFDPGRLLKYRIYPFDLVIVVWCVSPFCSSIANGLGSWDGISASSVHVFMWGVPYFLGRLYINDIEGARELSIGVILGALAYVPICIWESRMGPTLNHTIYGFSTFKWLAAYRLGGWRPVGFLQHGIELGMFMMSATLLCLWQWWTRSLRQIKGVPIEWILVVLLLMTLLCRSLGALALFVLGIIILFCMRQFRASWILAILMAMPVAYTVSRASGVWSGQELVQVAGLINERRAASLGFRIENENLLVAKAWEQPTFGWGGWARQRARDLKGRDISVTDGYWVIVFGQRGLVGLTSWLMVMLLPSMLLLRRAGHRFLLLPAMAPILGFLILLPLHTMDCMLNSFLDPLWVMMNGCIVNIIIALAAQKRARPVMASDARPRVAGMARHSSLRPRS